MLELLLKVLELGCFFIEVLITRNRTLCRGGYFTF